MSVTKYLVCSLDDEHYTDPEFEFVNSIDEAKAVIKKRTAEWSEDAELEDFESVRDLETDEIISYRQDARNGDSFLVNEVLIINNDKAFHCVHYHAYDGVDFDVVFSGGKEESISFMQQEAAEELSQPYVEGDNERIDLKARTSIVIDNGTEWNVWSIVVAA